jgi:hypothetical protein
MGDSLRIDWCEHFRRLSDDDLQALATWLAARFLKVSEFTDIVDRAYAQSGDEWRGRALAFVACCGRSVVAAYAQRKQQYSELMVALEDAYMCGALPGEVAPQELQPLRPPATAPPVGSRTAKELLGVLVQARGGSP